MGPFYLEETAPVAVWGDATGAGISDGGFTRHPENKARYV
jgi:hypothetical protein